MVPRHAGCRRRRSVRDDARGLALQTAVIAVTLLVVAGSVAWTLMRQGGSIVGATEAPGIGYLTEATCKTTRLDAVPGAVREGRLDSDAQEFVVASADATRYCVWSGDRLWPPNSGNALDVDHKPCHAFADGRLVAYQNASDANHDGNGETVCVATLTPR